ncbi:MAG: MATE family efflux transporter [Clostridia bacterium]|nr:MATE family efflux transporter [Clostridia bacterium]
MDSAIPHHENPLGSQPVPQLLRQFAVPSIVAMLVSAIYNIVDQFFIGQNVGELGNAATNIAFPLANACTAIALLLGIGASAAFNLAMGRKEYDKAPYFVGNAATMLFLGGLLIGSVALLALEPMLRLFGASEAVLPYAKEYVGITAIGFPFLVLSVGGAHLIRADGRPQMSMICNIVGAVTNTVLDAWFVSKGGFGLDLGMAGAAWATVIGQILSAVLVAVYIIRYKTVKLKFKHFLPRLRAVGTVSSLGMSSFFNQLAMMVVQIVLNNSLGTYGAMSIYGEDTPVACAGIVIKVAQLFFAICIGLAQGMQPIVSFNYGAKQYARVRQVFRLTCLCALIISIIAELCFLLAPEAIISLFSKGDEGEGYIRFAVMYFRVYLMFTFINFIQPMTSTFFTAIGKAIKGTFLSLTRQILFLLPLIVLLPMLLAPENKIYGVVAAGPIADFAALCCASVLMLREWKTIKKQEAALNADRKEFSR